MRTCPKVRGIAAHCVRLYPRNGETTAGLTELTITAIIIICIGMCTLFTRALLKKTPENTNQRFQIFTLHVKLRKYSGIES